MKVLFQSPPKTSYHDDSYFFRFESRGTWLHPQDVVVALSLGEYENLCRWRSISIGTRLREPKKR